MFTQKILPLILFFLQIISIVHLYIINKTAHSDVPVVFIELNIIVFINLILFVAIYFFVYKFNLRTFWILPIVTTTLLTLTLLIYYIRML